MIRCTPQIYRLLTPYYLICKKKEKKSLKKNHGKNHSLNDTVHLGKKSLKRTPVHLCLTDVYARSTMQCNILRCCSVATWPILTRSMVSFFFNFMIMCVSATNSFFKAHTHIPPRSLLGPMLSCHENLALTLHKLSCHASQQTLPSSFSYSFYPHFVCLSRSLAA